MFKGRESNGGAAGDERMSPSVRPRRRMEVGAAGMRVAGGRKEKVCLNQHNFFFYFLFEGDVRNWDSSGIADVPGLSMPQTQDTHTHTQTRTWHARTHKLEEGLGAGVQGGNKHARLHAKRFSCPWGPPPAPPAFKTMQRRISMH